MDEKKEAKFQFNIVIIDNKKVDATIDIPQGVNNVDLEMVTIILQNFRRQRDVIKKQLEKYLEADNGGNTPAESEAEPGSYAQEKQEEHEEQTPEDDNDTHYS